MRIRQARPTATGGGEAEKEQPDFYQELAMLDEKIEKCNRDAVRETSGEHMLYGAILCPDEGGHFPEQE